MEMLMVVCFGISWPINIVKAWKARSTRGISLLFYSFIIFVDSSIRNRSLWVGLLSIPAAFTQLMGYGLGFIKAWWKRCVLGQDEFQAFEKNFYK